MVAAAFAFALGACTSSPPDTSKPVAAPASASPSRSPSPDEAKILSVYDHFMKAYVQAYGAGSSAQASSGLTPYGGIDGGGLAIGLQSAVAAHVSAAGKPSWTTPTVTVDAARGQATAKNCFDPATWHTVNSRSHKPAKPPAGVVDGAPRPGYPGEPAAKYVAVTTLYEVGNSRWVVFATVAHRSQSC